jgi:hypothetical protein
MATMRKNYDFSKSRPNPYAKRLKSQVTIRIDEGTLAYFKEARPGNGASLPDADQHVPA